MTPSYRILRLQVENFMRVVAVDISPEGFLIPITGKNAEGKSSVINAIWAALQWRSAGDHMTPLSESPGYLSLMREVMQDCEEKGGVFHPDGCTKECRISSKCDHRHCDKFQWVISRANHYAEVLGIPAEEILNSWEKARTYWYQNFYQNCNQPLLTPDSKIRVRIFETPDEFKKSVQGKGFRCPACGGITSHPQICNAGKLFNVKICDWKAYGLLGTLGKGVFVYVKSQVQGAEIFTPVAWEPTS